MLGIPETPRSADSLSLVGPEAEDVRDDMDTCVKKCKETLTDAKWRKALFGNLGYGVCDDDSKPPRLEWVVADGESLKPGAARVVKLPAAGERLAPPAGLGADAEYVCKFDVGPKPWQPYFTCAVLVVVILACVEAQPAEVWLVGACVVAESGRRPSGAAS